MSEIPETVNEASSTRDKSSSSRRKLLKIGAIAAPAVLTLRPGYAWAASVSNCLISAPYLAKDRTTGILTPLASSTAQLPPNSDLVATTNAQSADGTVVSYFGGQVPSSAANRAPADYITYFQTLLSTPGSSLPGLSCLNSFFPLGTIN